MRNNIFSNNFNFCLPRQCECKPNCRNRHQLQFFSAKNNCCCKKNIGIQASLSNTASQIVENTEAIVFDTIVNQVGDGITYNNQTGDFTLIKPGNYKIDWQVIVDGANTTRYVNFGITLDDILQTNIPLPITTGLASGSSIIKTTRSNTILQLINNTTDSVRLSRHLPNANIVITSL